MRNRFRVVLVIASVAVLAGCGVEPRVRLGDGGGGEAGQGGTGAAGSGGAGGVGGDGGTGGGAAGTGGSEDPGCIPEERTDEFRMPPRPQVDVLWVIDNSKEMAPFVERLAGHLAGARRMLDVLGIDYHLAVTTTGLEESPDCDGPVRGGEDGRFVPVDGSRPRILHATTPDLEELWREAVAVGACHDSSHPLEAAWRALSAPLADQAKDPRYDNDWMDGNLGFLRPDATLAIVFVTAHGDLAANDGRLPMEYLDLFRSINGRRRTMQLSAITGPKASEHSAACQATAGDPLIALTDVTGGLALDICSISADGSEWHTWRNAGARFSSPQRYFLSSLPRDYNGDGVVDEADLVMLVDDVERPHLSSSGKPAWRYDSDYNEVYFAPLFIPKPGSVIRVSYLACQPG